jgi:glyoxylase-like metal-dependent hydrolase (beta-lactamase superfamily II)
MYRAVPSAILLYRQHPISEDQVLDALRREGKDLGKLSPQDLSHWDQDHYGGLAAVEALTRRAAVTIQSLEGYRGLLARVGFAGLLAEWRGILRRRLEMFRGLRAQTVARLGARRYDEYNQLYAFFVRLVESDKLGGARFSATAGPGIS